MAMNNVFVGVSPQVFKVAVKVLLSMDFLHVILLTFGVIVALTFGILELIRHVKEVKPNEHI